MKMKIPTFTQLPKWALYGIGVTLLVAVFAVGAFAALYIQSPFKASPPTNPAQQVSEQDQAVDDKDQVQEVEEPKINSMIANAFKRTVTPTVSTQSTETEIETKPTADSTKAILQIEGVKSYVEGNNAVVTWTTSIAADSRLIFDNGEGRVFESETGLGTDHKIRATALEESEEYDYKITATTADKSQYDDHYGIIYALKKYTAALGAKEDDCQVIIVKDTAGKIAANKSITLSPSMRSESGSIIARGNQSLQTNSKGEIKYCEPANTFKLSGTELSITLSSE